MALLRFAPYIIAFAAGFILALMLYSRRRGSGAVDWERRYREVHERYRDLTRRLGELDQENDLRANRLRRTLWDVRGMLGNSRGISPERAQSAIEEIDTALKETATKEETC